MEARTLYESVLADIRRHAEEALADNDAMVERLVLRADKAEIEKRKALDKTIKQYKARLSEVRSRSAKPKAKKDSVHRKSKSSINSSGKSHKKGVFTAFFDVPWSTSF